MKVEGKADSKGGLFVTKKIRL